MKLILDIVKNGKETPSKKSFHFDEVGGTIGRNDDCHWVLRDPNNYISGKHATVVCKQGTYFLIDESTNGTFLKNPYKRLGKGHPFRINTSDVFVIGDHELQARFSNNDYTEDDIIKSFQEDKVTVETIIPDDDFLNDDTFELGYSEVEDPNETKADYIGTLLEEDKAIDNTIDDFFDLEIEEVVEETPFENKKQSLEEHVILDTYTEFEDIPKQRTSKSSEEKSIDKLNLIQIIESRLDIAITQLDDKEQVAVINELCNIILNSLDSLQHALQIKESIEHDLHLSTHNKNKEYNPLTLGVEVLKMFETKSGHTSFNQVSISEAMQKSYTELNFQSIALHATIKNSMKVALSKFSPKSLEYKLESMGVLKGILPKDYLIWKAYQRMFESLNENPDEGIEMIRKEFTKEYEDTLYSLKLNVHEKK